MTMSPMTNSWSAHYKCTARWASGASGAPALSLAKPVVSNGAVRPARGRSCSIRHHLANPALRSLRSKTASSRRGNVQDGESLTEERGGIATTAKTWTRRRAEGRGRGKGSGTGRQVNGKTLITGTKQSTGIAEATTQGRSSLKTALYSNALTKRQSLMTPHHLPVIFPSFLLHSILTHCLPPLTPRHRGVAATCMI